MVYNYQSVKPTLIFSVFWSNIIISPLQQGCHSVCWKVVYILHTLHSMHQDRYFTLYMYILFFSVYQRSWKEQHGNGHTASWHHWRSKQGCLCWDWQTEWTMENIWRWITGKRLYVLIYLSAWQVQCTCTCIVILRI